MLPANLRDYLQSNRARQLEQLLELLRIPSISNVHDTPDSCLRAAEWLAAHCRDIALDATVTRGRGRPIVMATRHVDDRLPTLLIYGHYDVQPPDPLDLWTSPPFEPTIRDGCIWARGSSDDKGQVFAHLMAVEAWQRTAGAPPVNLKLLLEGEEEIGSPTLEEFFRDNADELRADACVISDSEFFADGVPSITYSLRGLVYFEITVRGPAVDLHSGLHGGAVANPACAIAAIVAAMHDADGRVTLDGFMDDVLPLSQAERQAWASLPFDEQQYARSLGRETLGGGEKGISALERRWARPTLDCNGIYGGYSGVGSKTVIPAWAGAKVSIRLVPNQDPAVVERAFRKFVAEHTPSGLTSTVDVHAGSRPVMVQTDSPVMRAAGAALAEAFGRAPTFIRCGASVPVTELIQRLLGLDTVLMGFGLPDDGLHSPNEHFRLDHLYRGAVASAAFMGNLAATWRNEDRA